MKTFLREGIPCYVTSMTALILDAVSIIPAILATVYWLYIIKVKVVNRHHKGSFASFFKTILNGPVNSDQDRISSSENKD